MIHPNADPWSRTPAEDALVQIAALHVRDEHDIRFCTACACRWPCDTLVLCQVGGVPR